MLLRLEITNFLSFYKETVFDMFPNPKRERLFSHIYQDMKIPLLKQAAIYGSNGAGKSNFVKVLTFLKRFVSRIDFLNSVDIDEFRYRLKKDNKEPICLKIEFCEKKRYYYYEFIYNGSITERLHESGLGEKEDQLIFERVNATLRGDSVSNPKSSSALLKKNPKSSVLALNEQFPIVLNEKIQSALNWFKDTLRIVTINGKTNALIDMLGRNQQLLLFTSKMLAELNIADNLKISETDFDEWLQSKQGKNFQRRFKSTSNIFDDIKEGSFSAWNNQRNEYNIQKKGDEQIVQEFMFEQSGIDGFKQDMDIDSQSDGSVRLLTLIPQFYEAIHKNKVVVIDEIENSMHPNLVYAFLKYYSELESNGQLIFTTHLTKLMDQQVLMRPDELWLVDKSNYGSTMRSLNDFRIHNTINIENGYLDGRYGGVPELALGGKE